MIFKLMYLIDLNILNLMVCLTLHINCNYIIIFIGYSAHNIKWDCHFEIYFFSCHMLSTKSSAIRIPNVLFQIWLIHY